MLIDRSFLLLNHHHSYLWAFYILWKKYRNRWILHQWIELCKAKHDEPLASGIPTDWVPKKKAIRMKWFSVHFSATKWCLAPMSSAPIWPDLRIIWCPNVFLKCYSKAIKWRFHFLYLVIKSMKSFHYSTKTTGNRFREHFCFLLFLVSNVVCLIYITWKQFTSIHLIGHFCGNDSGRFITAVA